MHATIVNKVEECSFCGGYFFSRIANEVRTVRHSMIDRRASRLNWSFSGRLAIKIKNPTALLDVSMINEMKTIW